METILLIDDELDNTKILSMSLRSDGYAVLTASSGEEGLSVFHQKKPEIIITDIRMPGMDGLEVLKQIRNSTDMAEVIIITGHGDIDLAIEALQNGASDFINKPIHDEALAVALKRAREKLAIKHQIQEYTTGLENRVQAATRELRQQANFQMELINSASDGIIGMDNQLNVIMFNPGAQLIFEYQAKDVIQTRKGFDLFPESAAFALSSAMKTAVRHITRQEISILSGTGESIPVNFSGAVLFDQDNPIGCVAFLQDLREIKKLRNELIRSERLAAIGQTVAGLAHCIKNILHGLEGGSYVLDAALKRNDIAKLSSGWEMIQRTVQRTSSLLRDLLSYSKDRQPEYQTCRPNQIVGDVCDLMDTLANDHRIKLIRDLDATIQTAQMDPQTVYRCLLNLVSNAIDACIFDENREKIFEVRVSTRYDSNNRIRFDVADTGCGMDEDVKNQLFSSFFSTKGAKGTGLGLLVTQKLIEAHHGDISVRSEPGKGTTFTLRLPAEPLASK
jgi:PAS domain S-box-containing protein